MSERIDGEALVTGDLATKLEARLRELVESEREQTRLALLLDVERKKVEARDRRVAKLEALRPWLAHRDWCSRETTGESCDCGLAEAERRAAGGEG